MVQLDLPELKTEMVLITNRRKKNKISVRVGGHIITSKLVPECLQNLLVHIEPQAETFHVSGFVLPIKSMPGFCSLMMKTMPPVFIRGPGIQHPTQHGIPRKGRSLSWKPWMLNVKSAPGSKISFHRHSRMIAGWRLIIPLKFCHPWRSPDKRPLCADFIDTGYTDPSPREQREWEP